MTPRERELADVAEVMSYKINRRFISRLLSDDVTHVNQISFRPGMDAMTMAFIEGQRNTGLMIMADIMEACPDKLTLMMKEAKEIENERRAIEQHERDKRRAADGELID